MKTIELKWIEDDNHVVAEDAYTGMKELIDTGVFPNLEVECKDDTLYITGEKEDLDKAVMKIQKAYAQYGQIMIKEAKSGETGLRIESFDDNVQDIFNHTLADYQTFKESTKGSNKPANYITTLGDFQLKFKKFKDTAKGKDKKYMDGFLKEIAALSENYEPVKIKPIKKIDEGKLIDADALNVMMELIDLGYQSEAASRLIKKYTNFINKELKDGAKPYWIAKMIEDDMVNQQFSDKDNEEDLVKEAKEICEAAGKKVINPETIDTCDDVEEELQKLGYGPAVSRALVKDNLSQIIRLLNNGNSAEDVAFVLDKQYMNEDANNDVRKHLSNPRNWGIIEEKMSRFEYNDKFEQVARMYAEANDIDDEDELYNELMDNDELPEWIDSDLSVYEIVYDKLMNESTKLTESLLSPSELKKKLTRVAAKWAYETGKSYEEAFNELRKKKSVKDMLDYYSVEEIIDDLKKKKKEVDDELEEEI